MKDITAAILVIIVLISTLYYIEVYREKPTPYDPIDGIRCSEHQYRISATQCGTKPKPPPPPIPSAGCGQNARPTSDGRCMGVGGPGISKGMVHTERYIDQHGGTYPMPGKG